MKIDIHCHVLGNCKDINKALNHEDIYYNPDDNSNDLSKFLIKDFVSQSIKSYLAGKGANFNHNGISSYDYFELIYKLLTESKEIDALTLLALDANYSFTTHSLQEKETDLFITNQYLYEKVKSLNQRLAKDNFTNKKFLFGASVNPNRPDWRVELDYVCRHTNAVLLKWIPSYMNIDVNRPEHEPFYKMLRDFNLPLLCHVGPEMAFAEGMNNTDKDHFELLETPLNCGVKVIAAHCASPMFAGQEQGLFDFINFMNKWNSNGNIKLWADTSALAMSFRIPYWKIYAQRLNPKWLVHGSDFPVPIEPHLHLPLITYNISLNEYADFVNESNAFDAEIKIKRSHGMSDIILENANNVLKIINEN